MIFPHTEVTITARDQRNTAALLQAVKERQLIVLVPISGPAEKGLIGTLVLVRKTAMAKGGVNASVKGLWRVRIEQVLEDGTHPRVRFTRIEESDDASAGRPEVMKTVLGQIEEFVKLVPFIPTEIIEALRRAETPSKLADLCAYSPAFSAEERLDLLRTLGAVERLEKVSGHFERQLADLRELAKVKTIPECETCTELADKAFDSDPNHRGEIAVEFLNHVVQRHAGELLGLLAEKYGPTFMRRRALK